MKDMNGQTILLISDMRQVYLAEILTKKGMSVRCLDIRNSQTVEEQLLKLKKFLAGAAMLRAGWAVASAGGRSEKVTLPSGPTMR